MRIMDTKDTIVAWLRDAYAMEQGLVPVLNNHAKDAEDQPEVRARIERHVSETDNHAERVRQCLAELGEQPSLLKSATGKLAGLIQAPMSSMARDEGVKNILTDYAAEHFEAACYRALANAARSAGYPRIADVCTEILAEELAMAQWLESQLPKAVEAHLLTCSTR